MLYTFHGGPLDGTTGDVPSHRIKDGTYTHIETGEYKSPLHILPEMTEHRYLVVDDTMVWCEPEKLT